MGPFFVTGPRWPYLGFLTDLDKRGILDYTRPPVFIAWSSSLARLDEDRDITQWRLLNNKSEKVCRAPSRDEENGYKLLV